MPSSKGTTMTSPISSTQYKELWLKLSQAVGILTHMDSDDRWGEITGPGSTVPLHPCSILQCRAGLPVTASWSTVALDEIDVSQVSLISTLLGVITERILIPAQSNVSVNFQIGDHVLTIQRLGKHWAQTLTSGHDTLYEEQLLIDDVAKILAPKQQ